MRLLQKYLSHSWATTRILTKYDTFVLDQYIINLMSLTNVKI